MYYYFHKMSIIDISEKKITYKNTTVYEYLKVGDKVQWEGQCYCINGRLLPCEYKEGTVTEINEHDIIVKEDNKLITLKWDILESFIKKI